MKKITPETRITRKYSTEKKKMWEKTPEVMQIEKARKISAQKKRAREMTPELMQLDKEVETNLSILDCSVSLRHCEEFITSFTLNGKTN